MHQETVTNKDGVEKRVFANDKKDLAEAVSELKGQTAPTYPNINVPVEKGKDLVDVSENMSVNLVDGRGAHNSPRDARNDNGDIEGEAEVPMIGAEEKPFKQANTAEPVDSPSEAASSKPAAKQPLQEDGTNRASNVSAPSKTSLDQGHRSSASR